MVRSVYLISKLACLVSFKPLMFSLLSPFSILPVPISTTDFITIRPVPAAVTVLIMGCSWAGGAGGIRSLSRYSCSPIPLLLFQTSWGGEEEERAGSGGGVQRNCFLCLKSDPIYLLIFLHLHSPLLPCQPSVGLLMGARRASPALGKFAAASILGSRHQDKQLVRKVG